MVGVSGINNKHVIIKKNDLFDYCSEEETAFMDEVLNKIESGRIKDGKTPGNNYMVINQDESYSDEVVEILKNNGHWG